MARLLLRLADTTVEALRVMFCRQCGHDMPVVELRGAYRCPHGHITLVDDGQEPF